jgi:hypothetical protein
MSRTRRLAAILAADVAGYSRLMGADEEGTLEHLKALRREVVDPKLAEAASDLLRRLGVSARVLQSLGRLAGIRHREHTHPHQLSEDAALAAL